MSDAPLMQLDLFAVERKPDGSVVLTPRRYVSQADISVRKTCQLLGLSREDVYTLIKAGSIKGWRKEGHRTKYRVDPVSALEYKARRQAAARS